MKAEKDIQFEDLGLTPEDAKFIRDGAVVFLGPPAEDPEDDERFDVDAKDESSNP